jgi:ABC-type sugar transport system ATPase subunit
MASHLLSVEHVSKSFGATQALRDVNFSIDKGTIHSLLGRNGAGKSTVVNIIAGIYRQTSGSVLLDGEDITPFSVFDRQDMGIKIVPQHASIVPNLTVGENVFMGVWPLGKKGFVDWKTLHREAEAELARYNLPVGTRVKVRSLNGVDQRKVNIIRAMHGGAKLIILDEPTTALSSDERRELFVFVNELKAKGTAFIFISHYLQEVVELSDKVTVIRDGMAFSGGEAGEFQEERLAHLIAGENVELARRGAKSSGKGRVVLSCGNVSGPVLKKVSVELREGEITGVVGFPSSGARELCRTIFGLEKMHSGSITVNGRKITGTTTPAEAMANGVAYLSNDRHKEGIVGLMPIADNISFPILYTKLKTRSGFLNKRRANETARLYFKQLNIKANSILDKLASLSGGNQQKVVYAKTLSSDPGILILDEPTIGIDIKSREEIIASIDAIANERKTSVVYLTNDFDELIRIVDRILFFQDGMLMRDIPNDNLSHEDVVRIRDEVKEQTQHTAAASAG